MTYNVQHGGAKTNLKRRDLVLLTVSVVIAAALTASGIHAQNVAELSHRQAGLYRQMPGIIVGLFSGYFLDSEEIVLLVTVAANAAFYYFAAQIAIWAWAKVR
jgi:hypothetical protein